MMVAVVSPTLFAFTSVGFAATYCAVVNSTLVFADSVSFSLIASTETVYFVPAVKFVSAQLVSVTSSVFTFSPSTYTLYPFAPSTASHVTVAEVSLTSLTATFCGASTTSFVTSS